jgi:hypothetical protein
VSENGIIHNPQEEDTTSHSHVVSIKKRSVVLPASALHQRITFEKNHYCIVKGQKSETSQHQA